MYKRSTLHLAVLAALSLPAAASASFFEDIEVNGFLKNETAFFLKDGQKTGEAKTMLDDRHASAGEVMKFENSARFFVNGLLGEESSWHLDFNLICDSEGVNSDWQCHKNYTQNDWFREAYIDTSMGDISFRLGKQQVVWGTADGIKLLDIINPTDFREMAQNAMEDSRIPIWMVNAEMNVGDSGNLQFIVSENRKNVIPGLNDDGDQGHPFIMKGVDSITGEVNGFLHVTPALAGVAASFNAAAFGGMFGGVPSPAGLLPFAGMTVEGFAGIQVDAVTLPGAILLPGMPGYNPAVAMPGYYALNNIAQNGLAAGDPNANNNVTNLMSVYGPQVTQVNWNPAAPQSAFEYMPNATFATFNTFNTFNGASFVGATAVYEEDNPDTYEPNAGFRYRMSLENGLNFSVNYFYHYSANPEINMSWHDAVTGEKLTVQRATGVAVPGGIMPDISTNISVNQVPLDASANPLANPTILLRNAAGQYYGAFDPATGAFNANQNGVVMVMEESRSRVSSIGGSFDYGTQWGEVPVVIRGEFLYDHNEKQPVVDKLLLGIGDLTNALVMEDMDRFSYVLGVDITVMTNLLISGQFIQMINLDYVDDERTCTTQTGIRFDCSRYTADFSTVHMTNGLNQGWEYKEFYSLFLSKPFGESQLGRWNNIVMYEDGGGWWDRFDVEYSFTDEWIGSAEINLYWGDEDTTFGQFEESSNIQVGIKYIWE